MIFGFPIRLSTKLKSVMKSSILQDFTWFLSIRYPCSLPWLITTRAKVFDILWVALSIIHLFNLPISCKKVWISSLEKFLWKKKIFVWQQPAAPDSIILVVHLAFPQPSLLFSVQNLRDLIYFTWSTINYWYIMTHVKELAWPDFLNVDKFCRDYCIAFFWIRSQI